MYADARSPFQKCALEDKTKLRLLLQFRHATASAHWRGLNDHFDRMLQTNGYGYHLATNSSQDEEACAEQQNRFQAIAQECPHSKITFSLARASVVKYLALSGKTR